MNGQLLTADQLAARWQVPPSHVYRLARENKIPCVNLGRYRRFRIDAIERFELGDTEAACMIDDRHPAGVRSSPDQVLPATAVTARGAWPTKGERPPSMSSPHATGYVRVIERRSGPVYYAKLKLPDGTQPQRKLGKVWTKRTRPPAGYLTEGMAQARLEAILHGDDPLVNLAPIRVTFGRACDEWLAYIEDDRKRRPSTVRDYKSTVKNLLLPGFGESTPIEDITTADVDAYRARLVKDGRLSPRTINKSLALLHGVFKRAVRTHGLSSNPVAAAERQPEKRSGEFRVLEPNEVALLANNAASQQDAAIYTVAAFTGLRLGELLALRWSDVDFAKRLVHVRRSYVLGREDTPKSHKVRSVPLIDQAAAALDHTSLREHFTEPPDLVFVTTSAGSSATTGCDVASRWHFRTPAYRRRGSTTCATASAPWRCRCSP